MPDGGRDKESGNWRRQFKSLIVQFFRETSSIGTEPTDICNQAHV